MATLLIFRFHAIYWPAFLMAAGLPLPKQLLVHAHWTMQKQKMSKSKGNVADPFQVLKQYGIDPVRYYLVRNGGVVDDSGKSFNFCVSIEELTNESIDYSEDVIKMMYTKDLAGQLGNLFSRATSKSLLSSERVPVRKAVNSNDQTLHTMLTEVAGKEKNCFIAMFQMRNSLRKIDNFDKAFEEREFTKAFSYVFNMLSEVNETRKDSLRCIFAYNLQRPTNTLHTMNLGI